MRSRHVRIARTDEQCHALRVESRALQFGALRRGGGGRAETELSSDVARQAGVLSGGSYRAAGAGVGRHGRIYSGAPAATSTSGNSRNRPTSSIKIKLNH